LQRKASHSHNHQCGGAAPSAVRQDTLPAPDI
jgi:hypothetical protein